MRSEKRAGQEGQAVRTLGKELHILSEERRVMRHSLAICVVAIVLLCSEGPAVAHHGFAAEFDTSKPVKLTGTVTKLEWKNPHTWFYIDVKNDDGTVTNWGFEMSSPNVLLRKGWTRDSLKAGDAVTVEAFRARDASHVGVAQVITLTGTGQKLLTPQDAPNAQ
jgi:Family of unknown function (DUF6152)